jgi:fibronectin type 3 domain-containing protein
MEIRDSGDSCGAPPRTLAGRRISRFALLLSILSAYMIGCAAPGEPLERKPPVPQAISDLAAEQTANDVVLAFDLPTETVDHRPLKSPPAVEIYRDFLPAPSEAAASPNGAAPAAEPVNPTLLVTIPSAIVDHYSDRGHVRYADSLAAEDFSHAAGDRLVRYIVRTQAASKKSSSDSNIATVRVYPAADPIGDVKAEVTHEGIHLEWTPPQGSPVGPAPPIAGYNIYRGEAAAGAAGDSGKPPLKSPLVKIGEATKAEYQDTHIEYGNTYVYSVRAVAQYPVGTVESADSTQAVILAKDTFPPAVPQGLVAVFVPEQGNTPAHVELSWGISPETDLAGYNVYRSGPSVTPGKRLNVEVLPTPTFQDMTAVPGAQYFYTVTAVDRSGNESPASVAVSGGMPADSRTP